MSSFSSAFFPTLKKRRKRWRSSDNCGAINDGLKRRRSMSPTKSNIPSLRFDIQPVYSFWLVALLVVGCATTTVTPRFPATRGLPQPDRIIVYDFAVTSKDIDPGVTAAGGMGSVAQTEEEIQVGRALAKALSKNLLSELRSRGINAYLASETSPPGETTASIRGQFMRVDPSKRTTQTVVGFGFSGGEVRTHVRVFQGTELKLSLVGEADTVMPSSLKPGTTLGANVDADAKRIAKEVAERVVNYYRQEGWLK
ncbi:MAG: hypothetical protein DME76_00185 [Verrucomicrobia bacterium]|nr:MAG: hypothetical protein DME76_00185 [Verrucomicrobiota bacterium]